MQRKVMSDGDGISRGQSMDSHIEMWFCALSDGDDEFGAWCAKALSAHNDVIDGKFAAHTYTNHSRFAHSLANVSWILFEFWLSRFS